MVMEFKRNGCLFFICCTIAIASFYPIFMWLSTIAANESLVKFSIEDFFAPPNGARSFNTTSTIYFDLQLKNKAYGMGIYYDNLVIDFSYVGINQSITHMANYTIVRFYQKGGAHGSTTHRSGYVTLRGILENETSAVATEVVFRVDLATAVKFKYNDLKSKKHKLTVRGEVKVNSVSGKKVDEKVVKLKPFGPHHSGGGYRAFFDVSLSLYILLVLIWFYSLFSTCK